MRSDEDQTRIPFRVQDPTAEPARNTNRSMVVLHVEEQADWFRCFTHAVGIPWVSVMSGWQGSSSVACNGGLTTHPNNQPCFWHPRESNCSEFKQRPFGPAAAYSWNRDAAAGSDAASTPSDSRTSAAVHSENKHNTASESKMHEFYDAETAAKLYQIFRGDFELLQYNDRVPHQN